MATSGQRLVQTAPGGAIMVARPQGAQQQLQQLQQQLQPGQIVRTSSGILVGAPQQPQQRLQGAIQPQQQQQMQQVLRQQLPVVREFSSCKLSKHFNVAECTENRYRYHKNPNPGRRVQILYEISNVV